MAGLVLGLLLGAASAASREEAEGGPPYSELIGARAPEWSVRDWIRSEPLGLEGLRGKVVLIRWWTGPGCPFCRASLPVLNRLHRRFAPRGLAVIGFYHEKSSEPLSKEAVGKLAAKMGAGFPVAMDPDWVTLKRYWLDRAPADSWTSVSFLIDQEGMIRDFHSGGALTRKDGDRLEKEVAWLLRNPPGSASAGNWHEWALLLADVGLKGQALAALDKSLALDPGDPRAWANRGTVLLNLGWPEEALLSYDRSLGLRPDDPYAHCSRASAFLALGRPAPALEAADQALRIDSSFAPAMANKARALQRLGREKEAGELFEKAFLLDPSLQGP